MSHITPVEEFMFLLVSEPGYSLKSEKGDLQWKMLDQSLHRLGRKALDEVYNTYISSPKKSYATLTTTATVWLWCNLTPSQALKIPSSHHEVYYDIFEQDHQALKNLCNAIKESIKHNPQLLHNQLFTLRYSLEKSTLHQNKGSGLFVDDPNENPRKITQKDIACVAEVLQNLSLANPTEDIFSSFISPIFKKTENIKTPKWLMGVLEHLSQTNPQSVLHDKISEYLFKQQLSVLLQARSQSSQAQDLLTHIINQSSTNAWEEVENNWYEDVCEEAWRTQFNAWKNSKAPTSVWHKKLPTQAECLHMTQWGFNHGPFYPEKLRMVADYPFDEDPDGLAKARAVMPFFQKHLLYMMLTGERNSRFSSACNFITQLQSSKYLSQLMKEDLVSSVQWRVWAEFGLTNPQTSDATSLKEWVESEKFKKMIKALPPLLAGTIQNVHNYRLGKDITLPMLRLAQLKKEPETGPFSVWNSVFTKNSIQKELGKKKRLQSKIKKEADREKISPPKRRM